MHCEESGSKVKYIFYDQNDYDRASAELLGRPQPNSISGTMKLHAVVQSLADSKVMLTRESVMAGNNIDFLRQKIKINMPTPNLLQMTFQKNTMKFTNWRLNLRSVVINGYVAAIYNACWFIGVITDVDETECQVNFMSQAGKYGDTLKWPISRDEIWIPKSQVKLKLDKEPEPHG
ncbi:unnamed protein product [Mytilus coruscus]|uniref:Uncharacterized protein n=1 Tax=Mytilus coruscus TaxID=42192 RepID=A0A6J8DTN2_MYTCO|nr:unnamed protein product [Mytilus coruscus]